MIDLIRKNEGRLNEICARFGVERLDVFGSAIQRSARTPESDVDLLVRFAPSEPEQHAERYFGLLFALEDLFGVPVDLVEEGALKNPYFIKEVNATRQQVYAE